MASRAALFEPAQTVVAKPSPTPLGTARFPDEDEDRVWLRLLALPFATMSVFLVALFGTGIGWFILPALVFGPGGGILAIVYLALTRDANAEAGDGVRRRAESHVSCDAGSSGRATTSLHLDRGDTSMTGSHTTAVREHETAWAALEQPQQARRERRT